MDGLSLCSHVAEYLKMVSKDEIATELGGTKSRSDQRSFVEAAKRANKNACVHSPIQARGARPQAWPYPSMSNSHTHTDQHSPGTMPCTLSGHPPGARLCASLNWYAGSDCPTLFLGCLGRRCGEGIVLLE